MGRLVVYTGGMRSGKSDALISQAEKLKIAGLSHVVIKHGMDNERVDLDDKECIVSRSGRKIKCISLSSSKDIIDAAKEYDNVLIDEIQFFDTTTAVILNHLISCRKNIWVSGLDLDYMGMPFLNTAEACALADEVIKLKSVCTGCGSLEGRYSYLKDAYFKKDSKYEHKVGDGEYESLCTTCFHERISREADKHMAVNIWR